ncbi:ribosome-associated ATPase/putative transporter RbbA [Candidatus Binatus sp.]|uniref:ribosome-associated ATPase/putative transporter RbbA n=1 Tax=Candidatus Binatus sp. TaxID=2811406 RepID=UPI003C5BA981
MSSQPDVVARLQGVTHRYGKTTAVESLALELPAGRLIGFIGPDGVGKSTVLALISGVRKIQSGRVEVLGNDVEDARTRAALCARIAYMPQGLGKNLYPTLSVQENIDFFGRLFGQSAGERAARIDELLASTALTPFRARPAGKLSGGMKQKLGLCCSLIHDPDLLILDEPTTGVDPLSRRQFWELIERIRSRRPGMSVLVATAYMEEAERFEWLVAMDGGKVLATGTPDELRSRTNSSTLEKAFVELLPPERRAGRRAFVIAPRIPSTEVAIEAKGLTRRFGDFTAVDHVSFHIERGEIFGFLGSNGCGKTTTMKMLTGLLPITEGKARLFGHQPEADDLQTRNRVGYMSQAFSLYGELTVRQNLTLHARLFHLPRETIDGRVDELVAQFGLSLYLNGLPDALPLGIRQRLSLAVTVIHRPEMLILDEPTSGVDPIARDEFWQLLIDLSRKDGVTIFLSTHFMNEAERCDRISLMHAGKVLAQGTPQELVHSRNADNLEQAFISALEEATAGGTGEPEQAPVSAEWLSAHEQVRNSWFSLTRLWAYAGRETRELLRDRVRLTFALVAPALLLIILGYGISLDVEHVSYAALDQDNSPESRNYLEDFRGSRYFDQHPVIHEQAEEERRLQAGEMKVALEVPPRFGRDLKSGRRPEIAAWVDASNSFYGDTLRDYIDAVSQLYLDDFLAHAPSLQKSPPDPANMEVRFRYNQDFKSVFAMLPGDLMILLIFFPAMLTALGIVREKELGSITNFYATPTTRLEFLWGKQAPYIAIALVQFVTMLALMVFLFGIPVKGSVGALVLGAVLYVTAATSFGLLVSVFVRTQLAAIFAAAIITNLPATQFSGWLTPVSSLGYSGRIFGRAFPATYFQQISLGAFTKGRDFSSLSPNFAALACFIVVYLVVSMALLNKQEK